MAPPKIKKKSHFFDAKITPQERIKAFEALSPKTKQVLKKAGYKKGSVPTMAQMDALINAAQEYAVKEVVRACSKALVKRDVASVNAILDAICKCEKVAIEVDHQVMDVGERTITLILQELELKAYKAFRNLPSAESYAKCWAAMSRLEMLDIPRGSTYPVNPWPRCRIKPPLKPGPYVVATGDWLSKIAERYYGQANLWDAIFETNGYDGHPDKINPGTRLTIYEGP